MQEQENKETNVKATIDAVTGLVTAIPIYQDTLQPSAKQIGKSLETVAKTVNIALGPIKALVWGYEKIEDFINTRVSEKLKNIPEENIVTPPPSIAGPAVEALRFSGEDINLRELYANLLAGSMDIDTQHLIHPGYVEILKNISSDEAILLQAFKNNNQYPLIDVSGEISGDKGKISFYNHFCHFAKSFNLKHQSLLPTYIDNLIRLGLIEIPHDQYIALENFYEPLQNDHSLSEIKKKIESQGLKINYKRKVVRTTSLGKLFIDNVVSEKQ